MDAINHNVLSYQDRLVEALSNVIIHNVRGIARLFTQEEVLGETFLRCVYRLIALHQGEINTISKLGTVVAIVYGVMHEYRVTDDNPEVLKRVIREDVVAVSQWVHELIDDNFSDPMVREFYGDSPMRVREGIRAVAQNRVPPHRMEEGQQVNEEQPFDIEDNDFDNGEVVEIDNIAEEEQIVDDFDDMRLNDRENQGRGL